MSANIPPPTHKTVLQHGTGQRHDLLLGAGPGHEHARARVWDPILLAEGHDPHVGSHLFVVLPGEALNQFHTCRDRWRDRDQVPPAAVLLDPETAGGPRRTGPGYLPPADPARAARVAIVLFTDADRRTALGTWLPPAVLDTLYAPATLWLCRRPLRAAAPGEQAGPGPRTDQDIDPVAGIGPAAVTFALPTPLQQG